MKESKIIYKYLSFKIVGALKNVHSELGGQLQEKYYQRALEKAFKDSHINCVSQKTISIKYRDERIGCYVPDFIIEEKIVLEIKRGESFANNDFAQVHGYLGQTGLKLGILALFAKKTLRFRRILNLH
ncbi:MAG TPA: GxxExxY protein [Candidatus Bipolaricaulota bacterium]|nr:GxxExxY protein [Candidatus Bipolaricaulota bacterium]